MLHLAAVGHHGPGHAGLPCSALHIGFHLRVWDGVQDDTGQARLALRYGWWLTDIVDLEKLTCPAVQPEFPCQLFWQRDLCSTGEHFVHGAPAPPPVKEQLLV